MNKHKVPRRRIIETNVKHFKGGVLRTITNTTAKEHIFDGKMKKKIFAQVYFKDFVYRYRTTFQNLNFFTCIFQ